MKRKLFLSPFLFAFLLSPFPLGCIALLAGSYFSSCALLQPGADPVVVNAERATALATDSFDTFVKFEYDNRAAIASVAPDVHGYANVIRRNGQQWLISARSLTQAYKNNRTPENKASLSTAIAVLQAAMTEVAKYTAQAGASG